MASRMSVFSSLSGCARSPGCTWYSKITSVKYFSDPLEFARTGRHETIVA